MIFMHSNEKTINRYKKEQASQKVCSLKSESSADIICTVRTRCLWLLLQQALCTRLLSRG